jgi:uncharacterized protein (TIGR02453 family)
MIATKSKSAKALLPPSCLSFLKTLGKNNNREWFNKNKEKYLAEKLHLEAFADDLLHQLSQHDLIETASGKKSLFRIYRDTRFSKQKTPFKTHWSGFFRRATKYRRGGYYFHIEPGNSFIAGGFWSPSPEDLKRIRDDIAFDAKPLRKILKSKAFVSTFGTLKGEQLKTTPKGFDADNEGIDLLRYKQYLLIRPFTDKDVLSASFSKEASITFKNMRPFFNYMSEVLTSDADGNNL